MKNLRRCKRVASADTRRGIIRSLLVGGDAFGLARIAPEWPGALLCTWLFLAVVGRRVGNTGPKSEYSGSPKIRADLASQGSELDEHRGSSGTHHSSCCGAKGRGPASVEPSPAFPAQDLVVQLLGVAWCRWHRCPSNSEHFDASFFRSWGEPLSDFWFHPSWGSSTALPPMAPHPLGLVVAFSESVEHPPKSCVVGQCRQCFGRAGSSGLLQLRRAGRVCGRIALADDYFVSRKLYPNVDYYSGIMLRALGIPTSMFTVMFAMSRTVVTKRLGSLLVLARGSGLVRRPARPPPSHVRAHRRDLTLGEAGAPRDMENQLRRVEPRRPHQCSSVSDPRVALAFAQTRPLFARTLTEHRRNLHSATRRI